MKLIEALIGKSSRLLEPAERMAVLGDLAEAGIAGWRALWEVLGLVVRRQAELWRVSRPPVAVMGAIGLAGIQLNLMSLFVCFWSDRHLTACWKFGVRYGTGLTVIEEVAMLLGFGLALPICCWTGGFVLAALWQRAVWVAGSLYLLLCAWPLLVALSFPIWGQVQPGELTLVLLKLTLQIAVQGLLVALPTIYGIRRGCRRWA